MSTRTNNCAVIFLSVLIMLTLTIVYYEIFIGLINDWSTNDNYSHGFFIPFITVYLIYSMRTKLADHKINPQNIGLLLFLFGLAQLTIGKTGSELFIQRTSIIPVLLGMLMFFLGTSVTQKMLIPILYLIFMIPFPAIIWNKIAFPMQLFSSFFTEKVIQLIGIPVYREGNILHLAETTLEVIDACSGLRSLVSMFALSTLVAWFSICSTPKKMILFFAAVPIAVMFNMIRLTLTAILASKYGDDVAMGFLHDFSGLLIYAFGLAVLVGFSRILILTTYFDD